MDEKYNVDFTKLLKSTPKQSAKERALSNKVEDMGIGALGEFVFPLQFRFLLHAPNHYDISWWPVGMQVNFVAHTITNLKIYDDCYGKVFAWIQDVLSGKTKTLTLDQLDGLGKKISSMTFTGVKMTNHYTNFSYEKTDAVIHNITLVYEKVKRNNLMVN